LECPEGTGDCPGNDSFCILGADESQPDTKFCTPIQCKNSGDCPEGQICNSFKQCVAGEEPGDVTAEIVESDVIEEVTEDVPVQPTVGPCTVCNTEADCGGLKCYPLGGTTNCFAECVTNDDCPTGWMCYPLTNEGKQCIPLSFNCDAQCLFDGCPEGKVCNQDSGQCVDGSAECAACQQDWDCAEGLRCYQSGKYCAPGCGAACALNSSCQEVNTIPVNLCVSDSPQCCYGPDCENACPAESPYAWDGGCVECLNDNHCADGTYCSDDKTCQSNACQPPTPFLFNDECVECLNSSHCTALGPDFVCDQATHKCKGTGPQPEECNYCVDPYPACTQINGVWSCVQCTDDSYCNGGTCDLTLYACSGGVGCGSCTNDSMCISAMGDKELKCDAQTGCCYDAAGWCDGVESMCNTAANSECLGLMDLLMGGMGGLPGMPEGMALGMCTCDEPMGIDGFLCLVMGGCPPGGCFGDSVCVDPSAVPMLGDMVGGMVDSGICVNLQALIDMVLGGF